MGFGIDEIISLTILICFLGFVLFIDKRRFYFKYTPITALSFPILSTLIIIIIISPILHFKTISKNVLWINLLGLFMFWFGGFVVTSFYTFHNSKKIFYPILKIRKPKFFILFFIIVVLLALVALRSTLASRSLLQLEDGEYAQNGLSAHLGNILTIFIIILIGNLKSRILPISRMITVSLLILCLFLKLCSSIKAEFFIPIISGLAFCVFWGKFTFSIKNCISLGFIIISVFIGMALFFTIDDGKDNVLKYGLYYFIFYLISGQLGFSEYVKLYSNFSSENVNFLTTFIDNVIVKLKGESAIHIYTDYSTTGWIRVSDFGCPYIFETNVFSLIGETYINCGFVFGSLFFVLLGGWTYFIFIVSRKDIFLNVLYAYVYGCLALSFFSSSYVLLPSFVYVQAICFVFFIINKVKINNESNRPRYIS